MELSNKNANLLMLDRHQEIEEYAQYAVNKVLDEKQLDFLTYPPDNGFTDLEKQELLKLGNNKDLKSALRKILADNTAGVLFNLFNLIDGTTDPKNDDGGWTGIALIDLSPANNAEPVEQMLHDKFYDTYWDWREIKPTTSWKLDNLEG